MALKDGGILFVLAIACSRLPASREYPASECDISETAVRSVVLGIIDADNARDVTRLLSSYTDDVVWLPPTGGEISGKQAIERRYRALFSAFEVRMTATISETRVAANWGFVRGLTQGMLSPAAGGDPKVVDDKFIAVLSCERAVWRVSRLMWSPRGGGG